MAEAVAINVKRGVEVLTFTCPKCNRKYEAPIYTKDFLCTHCFQLDYEWNYATVSKVYDVWKDTLLIIPDE